MNDGSDRAQLANIASQAKEILGADELQAVLGCDRRHAHDQFGNRIKLIEESHAR